jgi:hypothetical protein
MCDMHRYVRRRPHDFLIVERHAEDTAQKRKLNDGCEVDGSESLNELIAKR